MKFWKYLRAFFIFDWLFGNSDNSNCSCNKSSDYRYPELGNDYDDLDMMDYNSNNGLYHNDSFNYNHYDDFHDECDDYDMMDDF